MFHRHTGWFVRMVFECREFIDAALRPKVIPVLNTVVVMAVLLVVDGQLFPLISRAQGSDARVSFAAVGGPSICITVLYLLMNCRLSGGVARPIAAVGIPLMIWCWIIVATPMQPAAISASLLLGMLIPWALRVPNHNVQPHVDRDAVLIDRSHMEATGHYEARVNSIGSLYTGLFRSGFRVLDMDDWVPKAIRRARGVAFVAPQKAFSRGEVEELLRAEEDGAVVILATGQPDSGGSQPLLDAHELALLPRPMGTVTSAESTASRREREQQPRFLDAWPIVGRGARDPETLAGVEVIYRQCDDVVALYRRVALRRTHVRFGE
jgi:hypothetical protein